MSLSRCALVCGSHDRARRAAVCPGPSNVTVEVSELLAIDGAPASVANVLHRFDWVLITQQEPPPNRNRKQTEGGAGESPDLGQGGGRMNKS